MILLFLFAPYLVQSLIVSNQIYITSSFLSKVKSFSFSVSFSLLHYICLSPFLEIRVALSFIRYSTFFYISNLGILFLSFFVFLFVLYLSVLGGPSVLLFVWAADTCLQICLCLARNWKDSVITFGLPQIN